MAKPTTLVLVAASTVVAILIAAAFYFLYASEISIVVGLPMLSIGAVIVLVILLCSMSVVFATYDLQDRTQALALPEGSIRAVIALMLIVLFAILSIYLYGSIADGRLTLVGLMDAGGLAALQARYGDTNIVSIQNMSGPGFNVWIREGASREGVDFAKQVLVLVGTLVTSISSFYFGSKTATQSSERASPLAPPIVSSLIPTNYTAGQGPREIALQGANLDRVIAVKASINGQQVTWPVTGQTPTEVRFLVNLGPGEVRGSRTLTLLDAKLGEIGVGQTLEVS
ncbi:hypothetical protein ACO2RV_24970 [Ancylobacter sp. VNQ12]|uniref:hypothetical protein n=1 Tax=Ancylobacter sp. VNQ12 TaxID=3400920 RepID=UPI003C105C8F